MKIFYLHAMGLIAKSRVKLLLALVISFGCSTSHAGLSIKGSKESSLVRRIFESERIKLILSESPELSDEQVKQLSKELLLQGAKSVQLALTDTLDRKSAVILDFASLRLMVIDSSTPLVFSARGGEILLSNSFVLQLESIEELMFILAHEISHFALGHFDGEEELTNSELAGRSTQVPAFEVDADRLALNSLITSGFNAVRGVRALTRNICSDRGKIGRRCDLELNARRDLVYQMLIKSTHSLNPTTHNLLREKFRLWKMAIKGVTAGSKTLN